MFALDDRRVLRVYAPDIDYGYAVRRAAFTEALRRQHAVPVPAVLDVHNASGCIYAVEERVDGETVAEVIRTGRGAVRRRALTSYAELSVALHDIPCSHGFFGELLTERPVRSGCWSAYLVARAHRSVEMGIERLRADVPEVDDVIEAWTDAVSHLDDPPPHLVHGDFSPANVFVDRLGRVKALVDFSDLTVVGDTAVDAVCASLFLELVDGASPEDASCVRRVVAGLGAVTEECATIVRLFYSLHFSPCGGLNDRLYRWCIGNLRRAAHGLTNSEPGPPLVR